MMYWKIISLRNNDKNFFHYYKKFELTNFVHKFDAEIFVLLKKDK